MTRGIQWSRGLRIDTEVNGEESPYFVKIIEREKAAEMAEGEYEGQSALASYIPDNVVHPLAWGTFEQDQSKAFFLTNFHNLQACSPPLVQFLSILKKLHQSSTSPTGKFGFHVTTFYGVSPMINDWCESWEEFFTREFRSNLAYAQRNRGEDAELAKVAEKFISTVVPRLLRPLQTDGRSLKPTLCHGDLWDGNIQIDVDSNQPIIFDACCFYGHNEMDLQCMRDPRYAIGLEFLHLYKEEVGASEPRKDFDDRSALYSMRNDLLTAGMWPQWASLLHGVREEMLRLLEKYPNGLADFYKD
ncbi:Fructosamine/Ketosamine-3-kinase [Ilyonectria sp. MPI-CAGE-AT-0026]|nr:Fructosamine/Ketosamine-3-kinase [Ilyonectria sp. MPI-CAGE-AT-0026]